MTDFEKELEDLLFCDTGCGVNADIADGFGYCTCGQEEIRQAIISHIEQQQRDMLEDLSVQLFTINYHPTDTDACHNHDKHTPQCYGCRHAKWDAIIKSELKTKLGYLIKERLK